MEGNAGVPSAAKNPDENNALCDAKYTAFTSTVDPLEFRVIPSCDYALKGIVNSMEVLFQIKTGALPQEETLKRTPIDLAIVLDRSGSMHGDKIKNSRAAIVSIIENLTVEDSFHFITYDNDAETVIEAGDLSDKESLIEKVNKIEPRGSTNMESGLMMARDVLLRNKKGDNRTQRMYLFSDGLVNEGKRRTHDELFALVREIHDQKITCTTFGIGDDFDEDLMKGLAEYGNSYYFYIDEFEKIEKYVAAALGALLGVIGKEATLKVRGKNGGVVKKIYGHDLVKGAYIGDIKQSNLKNVLVELEFTPNAKENEEEVLTWELTFQRTRGDKEQVKQSGTLKIQTTEDDSLLSKKNIEVVIATVVQKAAQFDDQVLDLINHGNKEEAINVKKKEIELLKEYLDSDTSGRIASLLQKAEKSLEELQAKKYNDAKMKKMAKYHASLKRQDSSDWMALQ